MSRPVAICVPVRNERRNLPGLIASLARLHGIDRARVAIAFDGCGDGSEAIAVERASAHGLVLEATRLAAVPRPDAGRARAAALSLGAALVGDCGRLLTTDADTRPRRDWLVRSLGALDDCDVVCGRIDCRLTPHDEARRAVERYLDRLHVVLRAIDRVAGDAEPSHWHTGGASLGMTAAAWRTIGAAPLPPSGEDGELVRRARLAGLRVRQDPAVRVNTSSRRFGRATAGLADALREAQVGTIPVMEHPDDVVARARRTAAARAAFDARAAAEAIAGALQLPVDAVASALAGARSADAFVTALDLTRFPHRTVPLPEAAALLARHEQVALANAA